MQSRRQVTAGGAVERIIALWQLKDCYKVTSTRLLHGNNWRTATRWQVHDCYTVTAKRLPQGDKYTTVTR